VIANCTAPRSRRATPRWAAIWLRKKWSTVSVEDEDTGVWLSAEASSLTRDFRQTGARKATSEPPKTRRISENHTKLGLNPNRQLGRTAL
jgi:hypothetical protein